MTAHRTVRGVACLAAAAALLAGCSTDTPEPDATPTPHPAATTVADPPSPSTPATPTSTEVPVPKGVVGTGCEGYAVAVPTGPGALDGMGRDPVAVALGNSPVLTTFAGALMGNLNPEVNLFDALNAGQFTVFVPTDQAFGKLGPEGIEKFKGDSDLLTAVLNYHVVPGQLAPEDVVGEHKTVQGQSLTVTGSGDTLRVNDAGLVCGGIRTANATVYLIDTVLTIPAPAPPPSPSTSATTTTTPTP